MRSNGLVYLLAIIFVSCSDISAPEERQDFNFSLRYGVLARNELNTFENRFTKDLILDGTVTVPFHLPAADLDTIETMMNQIDFFGYPDTFKVKPRDRVRVFITPNSTYDFKVVFHSALKTLFWDDAIIANDSQATKLRELIRFIRMIVESKQEYRQLPPARGGYL